MKREDFNMKVLFGKRKERKICMVCMYIWYVCICVNTMIKILLNNRVLCMFQICYLGQERIQK